jgi:hypothetical protein
MMTPDPSGQHRPPFAITDDFLETAFERRFQRILQYAWQNRSWHIIAAVPGSGKSWGIGDLVLHSGAYKEATGITRLPILAIRAPSNSARELALATALAAAFGVIPKMAGHALRLWGMATIRAKMGHSTELDQDFRPLLPFRIKNGTHLRNSAC